MPPISIHLASHGGIVMFGVFVEGEVAVARTLKGIEERARNMGPAWPAVMAEFRKMAKRAFDSEGGSTSAGPWAPLKESTQRDRERKGFAPQHPILQRTRVLHDDLTTGGTVEARPTSLVVLSDVPYFKFHQSNRPRTRLPRRPIIAPTQDDKNALMRPIRRHVTGHDANAPTRSRRRR